MTNTASTLPLPTLIACLQERIAVLHEVVVPLEIGGLAELLEQAVEHLEDLQRSEAHAIRLIAELRRDYGEA